MPRIRCATRSGWNGSSASEFFAHAHELERLTGDGANGKRRAAAGIAIHFGEHDAGDAQAFVKLIGRFHGILAGHGIGHEQDFRRIEFLSTAAIRASVARRYAGVRPYPPAPRRGRFARASRRAERASSSGLVSSGVPS